MTIMKNSKKSIVCTLMIVAAAFGLVASTVNAQIFYVTSGNQGGINRFAADGTNMGNLISYGAGVNVQGIAVDGTGTVFVSRVASGINTIQQVTAAGVSTTFATMSNSAAGLDFNSSGVLYGVQVGGGASGGNAVGIYTSSGFTPITLTSAPFAPFYSAQSVKFDSLGNMYVTNSGAGGVYANSIVKLTQNGGSWDIALFASTSGFSAFDLAFDDLNNVYVSSATTSAPVPIRKYSSAGVLDESFAVSGGAITTPRGLEFANGSLYEADFSASRVNQINPTTGSATVFGVPTNFNLTYITYTAVPEPSQIALLSLGLGAVAFTTLRRKRRSA